MLLTANFTKVDSFFQAIELCNAILFSGLIAMLAPLGTIFLKFGLRCLHDALISNRLIGYWLLCVISFLNILHLVSLVALSILQLWAKAAKLMQGHAGSFLFENWRLILFWWSYLLEYVDYRAVGLVIAQFLVAKESLRGVIKWLLLGIINSSVYNRFIVNCVYLNFPCLLPFENGTQFRCKWLFLNALSKNLIDVTMIERQDIVIGACCLRHIDLLLMRVFVKYGLNLYIGIPFIYIFL